jgi:hypothetical protein
MGCRGGPSIPKGCLMVTIRQLASVVLAAALLTALACANSGPGPGGKAVCATSCPKSCGSDSDCTQSNQLCCDYGNGSKACVQPQACPRFCKADSDCNTTNGEACCEGNFGSTQTVCMAAASCFKTCAADTDCSSTPGTPKCCTDLQNPICTSTASCPTQCKQSSDCNTTQGETCCTSLQGLVAQDNIPLASGVSGLCLAQGTNCPKACGASTDCNTQNNELCCNGFCENANSCVKTCNSDSDCSASQGQLCCGNSVLASPWWGWTAPTPPPCGNLGEACCATNPACKNNTTCQAGTCQTAGCGGVGCARASDCPGSACCVFNAGDCGNPGCLGQCQDATTCTGGGGMTCP